MVSAKDDGARARLKEQRAARLNLNVAEDGSASIEPHGGRDSDVRSGREIAVRGRPQGLTRGVHRAYLSRSEPGDGEGREGDEQDVPHRSRRRFMF